MGAFKLMSQGPVTNFDHSWNNAANMLYLESPAGSMIAGAGTGWSSCSIGGVKQATCSWTDITQAVAYAKTLDAFYEAFTEVIDQDLYLVGESYAGTYVPIIATYLLDHPLASGKQVAGIALGNACWGGDETTVLCNGEDEDEMDVEIYHGKGLISEDLYTQIQAACDWSSQIPTLDETAAHLHVTPSSLSSLSSSSRSGPGLPGRERDAHRRAVYSDDCTALLMQADSAVGPYNVYNVYDDCNLRPSGKQTLHEARDNLGLGAPVYSAGFPWNCESDPALDSYFTTLDVQAALHLIPGSGSGFQYRRSGPASVTLYPNLLRHMRILIYSGDADLCVPYKGNEEWTTRMAAYGYVVETKPWRPWYLAEDPSRTYAPAGYVTTYRVPGKIYLAHGDDFTFLTVRLAGHMVPQYQPEAALTIFSRFIAGDNF